MGEGQGRQKSPVARRVRGARLRGTRARRTCLDPVHVVYVDMENPAAVVRARVLDLGYTASSDLSRLHYFHIPSMPPLDTDLGGAVLAAQVERFGAVLVVVDTTASSVGGGENDADTYRGFYRHTGRRLRSTGAALVRLDHGGEDRAGARRFERERRRRRRRV